MPIECRSCLNSSSAEYISLNSCISNKTYLECFNIVTQLQIDLKDENMPKFICGDCSENIQRAYDFYLTAHVADEILSSRLKNDVCEGTYNDNIEIVIEPIIDDILDEPILEERLDDSNDLYVDFSETYENNFDSSPYIESKEQELDAHSVEYANLKENMENTDKKNIDKLNMNNTRKMIDSENNLLMNSPEKKAEQKLLCIYCPSYFRTKKSLKQHEKSHIEESDIVVYNCTDCNRQYGTATLYEQHRKNVHRDRSYSCTICGNAFKLKSQLKEHLKLHLEKNIQCPHCNRKYAREFDLNVHLRSHSGEKPYSCHLCNKQFAIKVRLTYHLQKHYGIKHTCKECGAEFNSKQSLKAHSFKHTGMPYRCELCDNHGFPYRDVFRRHLLRVHNATINDESLLQMYQRNTGKVIRICEVQG